MRQATSTSKNHDNGSPPPSFIPGSDDKNNAVNDQCVTVSEPFADEDSPDANHYEHDEYGDGEDNELSPDSDPFDEYDSISEAWEQTSYKHSQRYSNQAKKPLQPARKPHCSGALKVSGQNASNSTERATDGRTQKGPGPKTQSLVPRKGKIMPMERLLQLWNDNNRHKMRINVATVGSIDSGKSTIMGHLQTLLNKKEGGLSMRKRGAGSSGKQGTEYSSILDVDEVEVESGITADIGFINFDTNNYSVNFLDLPGHKEFLDKMIAGTIMADVVIMVIESKSAYSNDSTCINDTVISEHARIIRSLGIKQLIIAVNKMERSDFSKEALETIVPLIKKRLLPIGFSLDNLVFVPVSGLTGENLVSRSDPKISWYTGNTLLEAIDSCGFVPQTPSEHAFFCVSNTSESNSGTGQPSLKCVQLSGQVRSGILQEGEVLIAIPGNHMVKIKAISVNGSQRGWAACGDICTISLLGGFALANTTVLCSPSSEYVYSDKIAAQIVTFNLNEPLGIGTSFECHIPFEVHEAKLLNILAILHKSKNVIEKKLPKTLPGNSRAFVNIKLSTPACFQKFAVNKLTGRMIICSGTKTLAAGIIFDIFD